MTSRRSRGVGWSSALLVGMATVALAAGWRPPEGSTPPQVIPRTWDEEALAD